jgi:hypothetical protein
LIVRDPSGKVGEVDADEENLEGVVGESVLLPGQRGLIARAASALLGKE